MRKLRNRPRVIENKATEVPKPGLDQELEKELVTLNIWSSVDLALSC